MCFLLIVAVTEFGDYIGEHPQNYSCPNYCEVDHKHINTNKQEVDNNEYKGLDSTIFVQSRDRREINQGIERQHKHSYYWRENRRENY